VSYLERMMMNLAILEFVLPLISPIVYYKYGRLL